MKEYVDKPIEGFFSLKILDKDDNLVDEVFQKNKIMEASKTTMANQIAGRNVLTPDNGQIGSMTLGSKGHQGSDILAPKDFQFSKPSLFSQSDDPGAFWMVDFAGTGTTNAVVNNAGYFSAPNVTPIDDVKPAVDISVNGSEITYTYELGLDVGNGPGAMVYTEASMNTNRSKDYSAGLSGDIFSMRTFSGKVKDNTVKFIITWKITF